MRVARAPLLTSLLLPLFVSLGGCSKAWQSEAIEAQVVDASTGAPVPDAIVLVNWQIKGMEGYPMGQLAVFERVTDAQGRFQTPAWGPKRPPFNTTVANSEPTVRVFKNGYEPLTIFKSNNAPGNPHVHRATLRLRRFDGAASDYAEQMNTFWYPLHGNFVVGRCEWRVAPRLFQALMQLRREFDAAVIPSDLPLESSLCHTEPR